jgi:hypothetical protein
LIVGEAAMLVRRHAAAGGPEAVADWIGNSPSRRKRARTALGLPKGWNWRRNMSSGRPKSAVDDDIAVMLDDTDLGLETDQQSVPRRRK